MKIRELNERCWKGYKQVGGKKKGGRMVPNCVPIEETRRDPTELFKPADSELDDLHHKYTATWNMLDHHILEKNYVFADNDDAEQFIDVVNEFSESMDHNAVITQDNAEVKLQVTTNDVKGLTILDFEFAIRSDDAANKLSGDSSGHPTNAVTEDLRDWFGKGKQGGAGGGGWDRYNSKGERIGKCGDRKPGEAKPKCLSKSKAASLRASGGKKAIAAAVRRKRAKDSNPERKGKAINVSNKS